MVSHPLPFVSTWSVNKKLRFKSLDNSSETTPLPITRAMMLNLMEVIITDTTAARVIGAIKLNQIEMWSPPVSDEVKSVSVEWSGQRSPSTLKSDSAMSIQPAHLVSGPPKDSLASFWSINGTDESDVLCKLEIPEDGILDVMVSIRLIDREATTAGEAPTAASTPGQVVYNYLDGFASAKLSPVGVTVIA